MNGPEKFVTPQQEAQRNPEESGALSEPALQEFLAFRNVSPESHEWIVALCSIPKDTIILGMHNFFSNIRDSAKAIAELERASAHASTEQAKTMCTQLGT